MWDGCPPSVHSLQRVRLRIQRRVQPVGSDGLVQRGGDAVVGLAALHVHRQTVYYRVQKIEQVTGLVLSRGDQRLVLHLGLTMAPFVSDPE